MSQFTARQAALELVSNERQVIAITEMYAAWIAGKDYPELAALVLDAVAQSSKYPERVLRAADLLYEANVEDYATPEEPEEPEEPPVPPTFLSFRGAWDPTLTYPAHSMVRHASGAWEASRIIGPGVTPSLNPPLIPAQVDLSGPVGELNPPGLIKTGRVDLAAGGELRFYGTDDYSSPSSLRDLAPGDFAVSATLSKNNPGVKIHASHATRATTFLSWDLESGYLNYLATNGSSSALVNPSQITPAAVGDKVEMRRTGNNITLSVTRGGSVISTRTVAIPANLLAFPGAMADIGVESGYTAPQFYGGISSLRFELPDGPNPWNLILQS